MAIANLSRLLVSRQYFCEERRYGFAGTDMIQATRSVLTSEARAAIVQSLVHEHQAGVRAFIRALGVDQAWVDDVAQETFLIAYRKLDDWDRSRDAGSWLRGIARHLAMNERRKSARRSRLLDDGLAELLIGHAEREPEAIATAAELLAALDSCLQELPQPARDLLRGRYADGETAESLAARWKTRPDAMRQKLLRLRLVVKGCVERRIGGSWA
jgi:RNA polymerase sigma-70 factor (ECF subfamily)